MKDEPLFCLQVFSASFLVDLGMLLVEVVVPPGDEVVHSQT